MAMGIGFFTIADSVYESGSGKQIRILFLLNKTKRGKKMMILTVIANKREYDFMTNDSGAYFFELKNGTSKQISCDYGFKSISKMKRKIKEYLAWNYFYDSKVPRLKFVKRDFDEWEK